MAYISVLCGDGVRVAVPAPVFRRVSGYAILCFWSEVIWFSRDGSALWLALRGSLVESR